MQIQIYQMRTCDNAKMSIRLTIRVIVKMTKLEPFEYWSNVQMATTVSCNTKSLIVGNGIRQWHSDGFLSQFTSDGTRKTG